MTTQTDHLSAYYEDLRQTLARKGTLVLEKLHKSLKFIEEIVNEDSQVKEWILERKKKISACKVEDVYKCPYQSVNLMGYNPGNNKILYFSILFKTSEEGVRLEPCITQHEYQYQSEHSSGLHWNRIIAGHRIRSYSTFSPGFSPEGSDSIWISHMCEHMLTLEDTRKLLNAYIASMIEHYRLYGENS